MTALVGFVLFLGLTLAGLGAVFWTGLHAQRRRHIPLVVLTISLLGVAVYYAEQLGKGYILEDAGWIYPFHLYLAIGTTAFYLVPVISGIATLRNPRWRKLHGRIAWVVLALTVLTAVTGVWMISLATKR